MFTYCIGGIVAASAILAGSAYYAVSVEPHSQPHPDSRIGLWHQQDKSLTEVPTAANPESQWVDVTVITAADDTNRWTTNVVIASGK